MKKIYLSILGATCLAACSNGNSGTQSNQSTSSVDQNPTGPLNYKLFVGGLLEKVQNKTSNKQLNSDGSDAAADAGVLANLDPYTSLAWSVTVPWVKSATQASDPAVSSNIIYQNIQQLQTQVTQLQDTLNYDGNTFANYYQQQVNQGVTNDISTLDGYITNINTAYDAYTQNVLLATANSPTINTTLQTLGESQISALINNRSSSSIISLLTNLGGFGENLGAMDTSNQLTNSQCSYNTGYNYYSLTTSKTNSVNEIIKQINAVPAATMFTSRDNSTLTSTLQALQQQLQNKLAQPGQNMGQNYIDLITAYNAELVNLFTSISTALQKLYTMEASINYVVYTNPSQAKINNYQTLPDCPSASLAYTNISQPNFINAQATLAQLYVNRINFLYDVILTNIISDHPLPNQIGVNPVATPQVESTIQAKTMSNPVLTNQKVIGGNWIESINLYQSPFMMNYKVCENSLYNGKDLSNPANCPSLLPNQSQGYYDSESMQGYTYQNSLTSSLNLGYCMPESGITYWNAGNANLLVCNYNYVGQNYNLNVSQQNSNIPGTIQWLSQINGSGIIGSNTSQLGVFAMAVNVAKNKQNFHIYIPNGAAQNVTLINGNGHFYLDTTNSTYSLYNGGIYNNWENQSATIQITLSNGLTIPLMISAWSPPPNNTLSADDYTDIGVSMPATMTTSYVPGVLPNGYYSNNGFFVTADGSMFLINITPGDQSATLTVNKYN